MDFRRYTIIMCLFVALPVAVAPADTPAHLYTVDLGPGNEDLEDQINALPWVNSPEGVYPMKDASKIDFSGRDLRCATMHFQLKGLYGARFDGCQMDGSTFAETTLCGCSFRDGSLRFCEMECAGWPGAPNDFTNADITGAWIWDIAANALRQTKNYREGRLSGVRIFYGDVAGVSFHRMDLEACTFGQGAKALQGCDFTDATLRRMAIPPQFSEEQLRATRNGKAQDYSELVFSGRSDTKKGTVESDFSGWDFSNCRLACFGACNLTGARFDNAFFLYPAYDNGGVLSCYSEFTPWEYYEIVMSGCIGFDGCVLAESQLQQTANWTRKDLRGMHLKNMNLDGWDFSGMNMEDADLSGSALKGAKFSGAAVKGLKLDNSIGLTLRQLQESKTLRTTTEVDIIHMYAYTDFVGLTDEQRALQQSLREKWPKP